VIVHKTTLDSMGKYDVLGEVSKKISALDNDAKLKILALLIEEGSKSITDIAHNLNLNFSTAHKYLEQLEEADLVASKEVSENRLKRLFTIRDFDIDLSPKGISEIISGGKEAKDAKKGLRVLDEKGALENFDEKLFAQKYLKRGMPQGLIVSTLKDALDHVYNGVTLLELRRLFRQELEKKVENIQSVFEQIEESGKHKRTYVHLLEMVHPEALDMYTNGDIFIRNVSEPKLFNFVHDIRGITIHGVNGKVPKTLQELFEQIIYAIRQISNSTGQTQAFNSFNYQIAPLVTNLSDFALSKLLTDFFNELEKLQIKFYINLDIGEPRFSKVIAANLNDDDPYSNYNKTAEKVLGAVLDILRKNDFQRIEAILKVWNSKFDESCLNGLKNFYIANMKPAWQTINASYAGTHRFDTTWKKIRDSKVGTIQTITINLPRIAAKTGNEKEFFNRLGALIEQCLEFIYNMLELTFGEFLRKYKTTFESELRGRWDYVHINDSAYHIALTGLNETIKILSGKDLPGNLNLAEKILEFCNKSLKNKIQVPIRLELKEARIKDITNRFAILDTKINGNKLKYSVGVDCEDFKTSAKLHKYFIGGHCVEISKHQVKDFLKTDGGLALVR